MRFQDRVSDLQTLLATHHGDAVACYPGPNTQYFAGIYGEPLDRHLLLIVPETGPPHFVTPRKSLDLIRDESWVTETRVFDANDPAVVAREAVATLEDGVETLLVDDRAPFSLTGALSEAFDGDIEPATPLLGSLRITKDEREVDAMKASAAVADEVSEEIRALGADAVGMTERELADEIRGRLTAKGGTRLSFPVVVASGPNAARPYVRHSDRRIREGEPVIVDFGAFLDEYASDQTRTVVFAGDPPEEFTDAYEAVLAALDAGVDAVEPGVTAESVHRTASEVVSERGWGDNLVHGTGHGVGLEAHEAPAIVDGDDTTLEAGMVFSVEPGIYVEDEWGVRVEDLVVVTADGADRLNDSPRTWRPP